MKSNIAVLLAGLAFAMLAGCQKNPETGAADSSGASNSSGAMASDPTPGSSPAVSTAPPGGSVAAPPASAPAPDSNMAPATSSGSSGSADTPTQANPADLKKEQEQATMPHSGQVNNHSVPDTTATDK